MFKNHSSCLDDRHKASRHVCRIGQNRIYAPYITVCLVVSLPKIPYIHRIYVVLANPTRVPSVHVTFGSACIQRRA